jgi:hypothetical protein
MCEGCKDCRQSETTEREERIVVIGHNVCYLWTGLLTQLPLQSPQNLPEPNLVTLMMEAADSSETSVQTLYHTRYKDPEGNSVRDTGRQSMNSYGKLRVSKRKR